MQATSLQPSDSPSHAAQRRQCLSLFRLTEGQQVETVAAITRVSRQRSAVDGIDGFLLFDGFRFCLLHEGPPDRVEAVLQDLNGHGRRSGLTLLLDRLLSAPSGVQGWASGYCDDELLDPLDGDTALRGDEALALVQAVAEQADLVR